MNTIHSNLDMSQYLMEQINGAVNALMQRSSSMSNCLHQLNALRVIAIDHGFDFAIGNLLGHKDLSVYLAAYVETFGAIKTDFLTAFCQETGWYMEPTANECEGIMADDFPVFFNQYILQRSFLATSPVGQDQPSKINIFIFAK